MGTDICYQAEKCDDGKWNQIIDESGVEEFFYFGAERNYLRVLQRLDDSWKIVSHLISQAQKKGLDPSDKRP